MSLTHEERMARFSAAGLYLVTSEEFSAGRATRDVVRAALDGGVRLIQLREKHLPARELLDLAMEIRELTRRHDALLILNDRLDVALAAGADGVHLGQSDLPVAAARRLAPDLVIGASTHSEAQALEAAKAGASYINIGPVFPTGTKPGAPQFLGVEGVRRIARDVKLPFTVMGGIKAEHIPDLAAAGARTFAVVTAVTAAADPAAAARALLDVIRARGTVRSCRAASEHHR